MWPARSVASPVAAGLSPRAQPFRGALPTRLGPPDVRAARPALTRRTLGRLLATTNRLDEAERALETALEDYRALADLAPKFHYLRQSATIHADLGHVLLVAGRRESAEDQFA